MKKGQTVTDAKGNVYCIPTQMTRQEAEECFGLNPMKPQSSRTIRIRCYMCRTLDISPEENIKHWKCKICASIFLEYELKYTKKRKAMKKYKVIQHQHDGTKEIVIEADFVEIEGGNLNFMSYADDCEAYTTATFKDWSYFVVVPSEED